MNILNEELYGLFSGYPIDIAQIGNASTDRWSIMLPYTGDLPVPYDAANLFFRVAPHDVRIALCVYVDGEKDSYGVEAMHDEIDGIMEKFFYIEKRPNVFHTRFNNGLSEYWLGHLQADFIAWRGYTNNPAKLLDIARQLTPEQRQSLIDGLQRLNTRPTWAFATCH